MKKYESIVVFNPELTEDRVKEEVAVVEKIIAENGGSGTAVESWGKKQISYQVKKHRHGHYRCLYYVSDNGDIVTTLTRHFRLADNIIKFQTHRIDANSRGFKGNPFKLKEAEAAG